MVGAVAGPELVKGAVDAVKATVAALAPAATKIADTVVEAGANVWAKGAAARGKAIENLLLGNNPARLKPSNFPVIDAYVEDTLTGISVKSIDLGAKTYQSASAITRQLSGYVDSLVRFQGDITWAGQHVGAVNNRILTVALPQVQLSSQQVQALSAMRAYAAQNSVILNYVVVSP